MLSLFKRTSIFFFVLVIGFSNHTFSQEIFTALINKDIPEIQTILHSDKDAVKFKNGNGDTPLHIAADNGYLDIVKLFISCGADINNKNNGNRSPLFYAMRSGYLDIVHLLVDNGAEITLGEAAACGFMDIIKQQVADGIDLHDKDQGGTLIHSAALGGQKEITELLIKNGADVNMKDDNSGFTPIYYAIINNHENVVNLLIKNGAELNTKDEKGDSPLDLAKAIGNDELINKLILLGAKSTLGPEANIHKLIENIFIINFSYQNKPNSIALIGKNNSLIIDTGWGRNGERLSKTMNELGDGEVKYIISTHLHGDHTGGDSFFNEVEGVINYDNLTDFVSSGLIKNTMNEDDTVQDQYFSALYAMNFEFEKLVFIPASGTHSSSDMIIWLKNSEIVVLGDILLPSYFQKDTENFDEFNKRCKKTIISKGINHLNIINKIMNTFPTNTQFIGGHGRIFKLDEISKYYDSAITILNQK